MPPRKNPYAKPDHFTRSAKKAGFPARSVFKLEEIDRRVRLLGSHMRVLDLGAAPGSWALYAATRVGTTGRVLAVDLEPLRTALPSNAVFIEALSRFAPYDVILSDMAPRTTGSRVTDQARSFELFMRALAVAASLGAPRSAFVGKIFMSDDLPTARDELKRLYTSQRLIRPESTRAGSMEIFFVGCGKRP
jgi:23S rRNA (uridine2552-2'-O)-methyltransferase